MSILYEQLFRPSLWLLWPLQPSAPTQPLLDPGADSDVSLIKLDGGNTTEKKTIVRRAVVSFYSQERINAAALVKEGKRI